MATCKHTYIKEDEQNSHKSHNICVCCIRTASTFWNRKVIKSSNGFKKDTESSLVYIWPCDRTFWLNKAKQKENFPTGIKLSRHHCWMFSLSCVTVSKLEGRTASVAQTEQAQSLLDLNNSWLTELNWPWKIPSVGLVKPGTAHLGQRGEVETDRWKPTYTEHFSPLWYVFLFLSFVDASVKVLILILQGALNVHFFTVVHMCSLFDFDNFLYLH